jgi:hypothetical protein
VSFGYSRTSREGLPPSNPLSQGVDEILGGVKQYSLKRQRARAVKRRGCMLSIIKWPSQRSPSPLSLCGIDQRQETERFRAFSYEELAKRDKASLDIFWLKDGNRLDTDLLNETAGNDAFRCSHAPRINLSVARIVKAVSLGSR